MNCRRYWCGKIGIHTASLYQRILSLTATPLLQSENTVATRWMFVRREIDEADSSGVTSWRCAGRLARRTDPPGKEELVEAAAAAGDEPRLPMANLCRARRKAYGTLLTEEATANIYENDANQCAAVVAAIIWIKAQPGDHAAIARPLLIRRFSGEELDAQALILICWHSLSPVFRHHRSPQQAEVASEVTSPVGVACWQMKAAPARCFQPLNCVKKRRSRLY